MVFKNIKNRNKARGKEQNPLIGKRSKNKEI